MAKSKSGQSKNSRVGNRGAFKGKELNGKQLLPAKYVGPEASYMAAIGEDGKLLRSADGDPMPWSDI